MAGERVQRYELVEQIGLGGMAEVYRARHFEEDGTETSVVVKKILPHLSGDTEYRTMFIDEAKIASTLRHPNIVGLIDLGSMDGHLFLALEFVDGADGKQLLLRAAQQQMRLSIAQALFIVREVLRGLHYAHVRVDPTGAPMQIVHRDVSPQNVFLSRRGEVKLGDFGIATAAMRGGRTVVGVVKGNPLYMAPEQVRGGTLDARTDVFAAGMLLLTLLCGHHPNEAEPLPVLLTKALNADVPRPSDIDRELPEAIDLLVMRATMLDPNHRFPSAADFAAAIEEYARASGIPLGSALIAHTIDSLFPARLPAGNSALPPVLVGRVAGEADAEAAPVIVETRSVLDASDSPARRPTMTPAPVATPPSSEPTPDWEEPLLPPAADPFLSSTPSLESVFAPTASTVRAPAPSPVRPDPIQPAKTPSPLPPWERGADRNAAQLNARAAAPAPWETASPATTKPPPTVPAARPIARAPGGAPAAANAARAPDLAFADEDDESADLENDPVGPASADGGFDEASVLAPSPRRAAAGPLSDFERALLDAEAKLEADKTNPQIPADLVPRPATVIGPAAPVDRTQVNAVDAPPESADRTQMNPALAGEDRTQLNAVPPDGAPAAEGPANASTATARHDDEAESVAEADRTEVEIHAADGSGSIARDADPLADKPEETTHQMSAPAAGAAAPAAQASIAPAPDSSLEDARPSADLLFADPGFALTSGDDDAVRESEDDRAAAEAPTGTSSTSEGDVRTTLSSVSDLAGASAPEATPIENTPIENTPIENTPLEAHADTSPGEIPSATAIGAAPGISEEDDAALDAPPPRPFETQSDEILLDAEIIDAEEAVNAPVDEDPFAQFVGVAVPSGSSSPLPADFGAAPPPPELAPPPPPSDFLAGPIAPSPDDAMAPPPPKRGPASVEIPGSEDDFFAPSATSMRTTAPSTPGSPLPKTATTSPTPTSTPAPLATEDYLFGDSASDFFATSASGSPAAAPQSAAASAAPPPAALRAAPPLAIVEKPVPPRTPVPPAPTARPTTPAPAAPAAPFASAARPPAPAAPPTPAAPAATVSSPLASLSGHRQAVSAVVVSPDGSTALSAGYDRLVRIWDLAQTKQRGELKGHTAAVLCASMSADGALAISGGRDKRVMLWDLETREALRTLEGHTGWIFGIELSADGRFAASASQDRTVRVWDFAEEEAPRILTGHSDAVAAVRFLEGASLVLSGSYDRTLRLWERGGAELARFECEDAVRAIAVSPAGDLALSAGADSRVTVWDLQARQKVRVLAGHTEPVVTLAFSRDGRFAVSGSYDGTARAWDVVRGACLAVFTGHTDPVMSVGISPDGTRLLTASADGTVRVWATGL